LQVLPDACAEKRAADMMRHAGRGGGATLISRLSTTCRNTARRPSTGDPDFTRDDLAQWSGPAGRRWSRCTTRTGLRARRARVHATRRRWRCSTPGGQDEEGLRVGLCAGRSIDAGLIYESARPRRAVPDKFLPGAEGPYAVEVGKARWCATSTPPTTASSTRDLPGRVAAGCLAHARRKYPTWPKPARVPCEEALRRIAAIYKVERELASRDAGERLALARR